MKANTQGVSSHAALWRRHGVGLGASETAAVPPPTRYRRLLTTARQGRQALTRVFQAQERCALSKPGVPDRCLGLGCSKGQGGRCGMGLAGAGWALRMGGPQRGPARPMPDCVPPPCLLTVQSCLQGAIAGGLHGRQRRHGGSACKIAADGGCREARRRARSASHPVRLSGWLLLCQAAAVQAACSGGSPAAVHGLLGPCRCRLGVPRLNASKLCRAGVATPAPGCACSPPRSSGCSNSAGI